MSETPQTAQDLLDKLHPQHREFVEHYVRLRGNAKRAALAAGYTEATANDQSWALRRRPDIKAAIDALMRESAISVNELKSILEGHARATIEPFLCEDGSLTVATDDARDALHTVQSAKHTRRTVTTESACIETDELSIKLHNAQAATIALLKIAGEAGPDLNVTFKVIIPEPGKK
jgi:phage terminase small subunit